MGATTKPLHSTSRTHTTTFQPGFMLCMHMDVSYNQCLCMCVCNMLMPERHVGGEDHERPQDSLDQVHVLGLADNGASLMCTCVCMHLPHARAPPRW